MMLGLVAPDMPASPADTTFEVVVMIMAAILSLLSNSLPSKWCAITASYFDIITMVVIFR